MNQITVVTQNKQEYSIRQYLKSIQTIIINALRVKPEFKEEYAQYAILNSSQQITELLHQLISPLFLNDNYTNQILMKTMKNPFTAGVGFQNLAVYFRSQTQPVHLKQIFNPAGKLYKNFVEGWSKDDQEEQDSDEEPQQLFNEQKIMTMIDIEAFQSQKKLHEKEKEVSRYRGQVKNLEDSVISMNNKLTENEHIIRQLQSSNSTLEIEGAKLRQNVKKLEEQNFNLALKLKEIEIHMKNFLPIEVHNHEMTKLETSIFKLEHNIKEKDHLIESMKNTKSLVVKEAQHLKQELNALQDQYSLLKKQSNHQQNIIDKKELHETFHDTAKENFQESRIKLFHEAKQEEQIEEQTKQETSKIPDQDKKKNQQTLGHDDDLQIIQKLNPPPSLEIKEKENIKSNRGNYQNHSKSPQSITKSVSSINNQQEILTQKQDLHEISQFFENSTKTCFSKSQKYNLMQNNTSGFTKYQQRRTNIFSSSQSLLQMEKEIQTEITIHPGLQYTSDQFYDSFKDKQEEDLPLNLENFQKQIGQNKFLFGTESITHVNSRKNSRFFGKPQQYNIGEILTKLNLSFLRKSPERNTHQYLKIDTNCVRRNLKLQTQDSQWNKLTPDNSPKKQKNSIQKLQQRRLGNKFVLLENNSFLERK